MPITPLLSVLLLVGCPKPGLQVDLEVPEAEERVDLGGPLDVLSDAAGDLDPTPRARALALLVRASDEPAGGDWGARGLYDPSPWVQRQVVDALAARLPEEESAAALAEFVGRSEVDPYVRASAAFRLAAVGDTRARDVVSAAWKEENQAWRQAPLASAALALGDDEAKSVALEALASGDVALEVDFVLDLGRSGLTELLPALKVGGELVEEELVLPYAAARVALGDASGEGVLRKSLTSGEDLSRLEALDYLSKMHDPGVVGLLRKARSDDAELVRWYATTALAGRAELPVDRLVAAMEQDDIEIQLFALRFAGEAAAMGDLSKKDTKAARTVLQEGLAADEPVLREAALRGFVGMGLDGEKDVVRHNLGNEFVTVRVEAAGLLLMQ